MSQQSFQRIVLLVVVPVFLTACGGGGHSTPMAPMFTSMPGTAAEQGVLYSYQVAATDPAGGTVSFSLSTSPTGAGLSGNGLSWTPTAAQSRVSNSFTITATTSSGGSATQSWKVTPNGTITVSWIDTAWGPNGQVQRPAMVVASALVPQADGSYTAIGGTLTAPGVTSIPNVPAGFYWLLGGPATYWTNSSTVDLGSDVALTAPRTGNSQLTTFDLNASGLESSSAAGFLGFASDAFVLPPAFPVPADSTTLSTSYSQTGDIDWSQVSTAFLLQYTPASLGPLTNYVLGPAATLSNLSLVNGGTNQIAATLTASMPVSLDLSVPGTQWAPLLNNVAPEALSRLGSGLSVAAEPFVVGPNLRGSLTNLPLVTFDPQLPVAIPCIALFQPAILTDQSLGTLQYGDSFPSAWTRSLSFCQGGLIPININSQVPIHLSVENSVTVAPASTTLAPMTGPVQNPMINGASLFMPATLSSTTPTLSWSAPVGPATPFGYSVAVLVVTTINGFPAVGFAGSYTTAQTSLTLPPLTAGNTYLFEIASRVDGAAKVETQPNRSALPTAFANVVSAMMTINSGAVSPAVRGDARVMQRLSRRPTPLQLSSRGWITPESFIP